MLRYAQNKLATVNFSLIRKTKISAVYCIVFDNYGTITKIRCFVSIGPSHIKSRNKTKLTSFFLHDVTTLNFNPSDVSFIGITLRQCRQQGDIQI